MSELRRDAPLFDQLLSIYICKDDIANTFCFRILHGLRQHQSGQQEKYIHFEITDDDDPYFLYFLDVGEQDFHQLKRDQGLLVDFSGFPSKFIELLNLCVGKCVPNSQSTSSFITRLDTEAAVFSIIESNEFKHLTHISLQLRPGNDAAIKSYLASRLHQFMTLSGQQEQRIYQQQEELRRCHETIQNVSDMNASLRNNREKELETLQHEHRQALFAQKQQAAETLEMAKRSADETLHSVRANHTAQMEAMTSRINDLETQIADMTKLNMQLEYQLKELNINYQKATTEREYLTKSSTEYTATITDLQNLRVKHELEVATLRTKVAGLEEQVQDKMQGMEKTMQLKKSVEEMMTQTTRKNAALEESLMTMRDKLKNAAAEISRGNEIILSLKSDNEKFVERIAMKNDILKRQEQVISSLKQKCNELQSDNLDKQQRIQTLSQVESSLRSQISDLNEKIAEGADIIARNKEVINHLNDMINSLQIGHTNWNEPAFSTPVAHTSKTVAQNVSPLSHSPSTVAYGKSASYKLDTPVESFEPNKYARPISGSGGKKVYAWQMDNFAFEN